eukprot:scaffold88603_cov16-Tisochrysis_lutea.AAC.1
MPCFDSHTIVASPVVHTMCHRCFKCNVTWLWSFTGLAMAIEAAAPGTKLPRGGNSGKKFPVDGAGMEKHKLAGAMAHCLPRFWPMPDSLCISMGPPSCWTGPAHLECRLASRSHES